MRRDVFERNLVWSLLQCVDGDSYSHNPARRQTQENVRASFVLSATLDSLAVARVNTMFSKLCALPSGRTVVNELMRVARENNFVVQLMLDDEFAAGYPQMIGGRLTLPIYLNFEEAGLSEAKRTFARLSYDRITQHHGIRQMLYPPFILFAHEITHGAHHILRYRQLLNEFGGRVPTLDANIDDWRNFAKSVCTQKKCLDIYNAHESNPIAYQVISYRALAIDEFRQRFGFTSYDTTTDVKKNAMVYWNDNQEEESLTIIGDGQFSDRIFLEEARDQRLLRVEDGFDEGSIFRWGHGFFSKIQILLQGNAQVLSATDQSDFDNCVRLFSAILPDDLK
jgi:hypothetical protein